MPVEDADGLMRALRKGRFAPEQLDPACFDTYRLKNAAISFTVNQTDAHTVRLCAKCPNTALKRLFKTVGLDADGSVPHVKTAQALQAQAAADVLHRQVVKYTRPDVPGALSLANITAAL